MRAAVSVLALLVVCGCGHNNTPAPTVALAKAVASDPENMLYKRLRTADYQIDGALDGLNDALEECKNLAPKAGGDAEKALLSVIELLDGAGEALSDYENVPETLDEFKKDFASQDERRIRSIKIVLDALQKTSDASDILDDLSQNVPKSSKKDLDAIVENVAQSQSDLQEAVVSMGGQVPDDRDAESQDPAQDKAVSR